MKKFFAALAALFFVTAAYAQNPGAVTNHAFAIGRGAGIGGYTSLLCGSAQLAVGQAAADPICRTITGDATLSAAGAITLATVNAGVGSFGSATQCTSVTVNAKGLITAASQALCTPAVGSITGLGANVATWLGTPSSANLRAALTDETGNGLAYFQNGDLGTPSAGIITNMTGTCTACTANSFTSGSASNLNAGTLPAARTNGHMNGTATNDNAAAGEIGEYSEASVASGSAVALTTNVAKTITSITLPSAGDWEVGGHVAFTSTASTSFTIIAGSLSLTTDTSSSTLGRWNQTVSAAFVPNGVPVSTVMGPSRFLVSGPTTVYLVAFATFTVSTSGGYGNVWYRRAR
jgi:hypothetical protein